jgi:hypothetical protein
MMISLLLLSLLLTLASLALALRWGAGRARRAARIDPVTPWPSAPPGGSPNGVAAGAYYTASQRREIRPE